MRGMGTSLDMHDETPTWSARIEPVAPLFLAVHGALLLSGTSSRPVQWVLVLATAALGVMGLLGRRSPADVSIRAWVVAIITWALLYVSGGVPAFFTLWYFLLVAVYPLVLSGRSRFAYPVAIGVAYLALPSLTEGTLPLAVLWGRTGVITATGLLVAGITAAQRHAEGIAHERRRERDRVERVYRQVVDSAGDAVVGFDMGLGVVLFNRRSEEMFGLSAEAVLGADAGVLEEGSGLRTVLRDAVGTEGFSRTDPVLGRGRRVSGESFPIEATVSRLDGDGPLRLVAVIRDVTEQTEVRMQLQRLVSAKDEFVASVSHELRTPLTAVVGLASVLHDRSAGLGPEEIAEFSGLVASQAAEVGHIVDDLLVAARADIGQVTILPEQIDVGDVLDEVIDEARRTWGVDPKPDVAGNGPLVAWADGGRVRQIIRNLFANTARYGGERIEARIRGIDGHILVEIADDGSGISGEDAARVFEPYERFHDHLGRPGSIGLGLSVSRQLARLMNGDLTYHRREGWTVFALSLPKAGGSS